MHLYLLLLIGLVLVYFVRIDVNSLLYYHASPMGAGGVMFVTCPSACWYVVKGKVKVFPYSLPSVGPGADPGVQAVSPQVT